MRGGAGTAYTGVTDGPSLVKPDAPEEGDEFKDMGPWLEDSDADVFKSMHGLVLRQELIAINHLACDTHWLYVKQGYPWSTLTKNPNRSSYQQSMPYGSAGITIQAVPNKAWDVINKTTEKLVSDFPIAECDPGDDSEDADAACEWANRFLSQDAGEDGTNDTELWWDRINRALTTASAYVEYWADPTGGGYVPLQILAHPTAPNPQQPAIGEDGMPTPNMVERYVTGPIDPKTGMPGDGAQFTDDPTKAAPQWQPKIRASKWERQHVRCYPESAPVELADKVIILGYCTLAEGKKRWPSLAEMGPDELAKLCDWTPTRFYTLLPPFQRARWALTDAQAKQKAGSSDERLFFYYHGFAKAQPDYPKGADVVVTGAMNNFVIARDILSMEVPKRESPQPEPSGEAEGAEQEGVVGQISADAAPPINETRCLTIPVVQLTPRGDPDELDPTGRAYIELGAGAIENNAHLAMSASEVIDKNLHLEGYTTSTSPVEGWQRAAARASGDLIPIMREQDKPSWGERIPLEQGFFNFYNVSDEAINSIYSTERGAQGSANAQERSGKAIQLATSNNNVGLTGMNHAFNNTYARASRIKLELAMKFFTTTQQLNYVGEDGAYKQESFDTIDFAKVGKVRIKDGTGTLVAQDQKIMQLQNAGQAQLLTVEEIKDAVRPIFSTRLGLPPDPSEQRIERQVGAWLDGPPPEWEQVAQQYQMAQQQFQAAQQQFQMAQQRQTIQQAVSGAVQEPPPQAPQPPVPPYSPFVPLPTDSEPPIAAYRMRRLRRLIDTAKFSNVQKYPPLWQQLALDEYARMGQVIAAAQPAPALPKGVTLSASANSPENLAAEEQAALHPGAQQPQQQQPPPGGPPKPPAPPQGVIPHA